MINKHLENDRELFIHQLITQLSSLKVELLNYQENSILQSKSIALLQPEIIKGIKAENAIEILQKKLLFLKNQFDNLSSDSEKDLKTLQIKNNILEEQCYNSGEKLSKLDSDLCVKLKELKELQDNHDDKVRDVSVLESSFEKAVDDEVKSKLNPITEERNTLFSELNELKLQYRFQADDLQRTKEILNRKINDEVMNKEQVNVMMAQVESMLEQEASESNKTITEIHNKMKQLKSNLSSELQQERRLTSVLQTELQEVRRDKEEKTRDLRISSEEINFLREKLSGELKKTAILQCNIQNLSNNLLESIAKVVFPCFYYITTDFVTIFSFSSVCCLLSFCPSFYSNQTR